MKQSAKTVTVEELKKKYASKLSDAEKTLRNILELEDKERLIFQEGWLNDRYSHNIGDDNCFELLYIHSNDESYYAIPVEYCNSDGTSVNNGNWNGKKIWTLFMIMSSNGNMTTEFIPNRYDMYSNMHPDFKAIGYSKNFLTHIQYADKKRKQKAFDVKCYIECKNEEKRIKEEARRCAPANITVGQFEDLMSEFREMKEMIRNLAENIISTYEYPCRTSK